MKLLLLTLLAALCAWLLFAGFRKPKLMVQYPFLASAVFTGWVLPQIIGISNNTYLPAGALVKTLLMTLLCLTAIYLGDIANKKPFCSFNWRFSQRRLLIASTALSIGGAYFFYKVGLLREEVTSNHGGAWTGIITIYVFFASMLTFGLVLALLAYLQRPNRWAFLIILFDGMFYFHRIILLGRRQAAAELFVILALACWFRWRRLPPRWVVGVVLVVGTLWVNSVGEYRHEMMSRYGTGLQGASKIDFVGNFRNIFNGGGKELTNAAYDIEATDRLSSFDFGLSHWNGFVRAYIPGQIIGHDVKKDIMADLGDAAYRVFYYVPHTGTTHTGMSDAFLSFWYFGAIKFFVIAYIMSRLCRAANQGHMVAQMLLMLVFVGGLESITHGTDRFFMAWPKIIAFLSPALWYAKVKLKHPYRYNCPSSRLNPVV